ncbi:hypothetical protein HPB48_010993 [Haemaphysalis longicornis]|uniref:Uncharacterized protein n=1 Tax=Haemaphysalis longicornis TaxID=44386 RepID=A0A9J6FWF5_HAELO|nr:hypothetical protein HPB48_010993 [Haemaphysalis longicornis]
MVFCTNVATLVWRTLYLQAVRRHYMYAALELLFVAFVYYGGKAPYLKPAPLESPMPLPLENVSFDQVTAVVYGPSTGYTDSLMEPVIDMVTQPRQQNTREGKRWPTLWVSQRRK